MGERLQRQCNANRTERITHGGEMRRYTDVEEAVCALLELRAFYDSARAPDISAFLELGCFVDGGTFESDHVARAHKAELEDCFKAACVLVPLHKWACWVDLRVERVSERDARRRHNERVLSWGKDYLTVGSKNTTSSWSREIDGVVEGELARRGWIKQGVRDE